ncbi:protein rolling stone [Diabrotica virgifera virgifera]|uniref:Protein rolling stone-like n=1 Tax=Diabrotica virgifera virgifera TaxID=50390 RepID=A0A6P7FTH4_DIAVI|nr:protein rolling stone [Diabrotica virgifera virgifera]XP_028139728.1 protein rolling stone [Diabrotica virgifera virgifera]XP_028139729.1 protein rolling stone [Diabrotica virgifera virgifera]XP_050497177.1 protein rolling stone [Diabrotica virgifera virgifera]
MLTPLWRDHFAPKNFYLLHDDPNVFLTSQWQRNKTEPNIKYLIYRTIVMLIFFITWILSIIEGSGKGKYPIYLTNWGYTGCTIQALIAFLMLFMAVLATKYKSMHRTKEKTLKLYPVYWLLNTVATSTAFAITTIYWSVIYNPKKVTNPVINYFVHGNNSLMVLLDLWIVGHPIRILHVIYTVLLGVTYTIFTLIYYSAGGTNKDGYTFIYKIVDWTKPGLTVGTCCGVIVFLIILHLLMFLISSWRRSLQEKHCGKEVNDNKMDSKQQAAYVNEAMSNDIV